MKIVASDYDGTLNNHGISDIVRDAIRRWQGAGHRFGIVTGRGIYNIRKTAMHDNVVCDYFIANNGAVVADKDGVPIAVAQGDPAAAGAICSFVLDNGGLFACVNDLERDHFFCSDREKETDRREDARFLALSSLPSRLPFTQISTVCTDGTEAKKLTERLNERFGGIVTALQNGNCIDIVPAGIDKAVGIRRLLQHLGVSEDAVCAVGDNSNDIAMLKAFRSYAVENATDEVKSIAHAVVYNIAELIEREM